MDQKTEITPTTPTPSPVQPRPWLAIALIALVLVIIGFLFYQNYQLKKQLASLKTASQSQPPFISPEPVAEADDPTAGWKTYSNKDGGYEIKYPTNWAIDTYTQGTYKGQATIKYSGITLSYLGEIKVVPMDYFHGTKWANISTSEFFDPGNTFWTTGSRLGGGPGTDYFLPKELTVGDNRAMVQITNPSSEYDYSGPWLKTYNYYIPTNNGKVAYIYFTVDDRNSKKDSILREFDQILSTFKFTN